MRKKLFPYLGSKLYVVDTILEHFPKNYPDKAFIEVFGGSGIILFRKKKSVIEVFNDLDEGITAIFYCLIFRKEEFLYKAEQARHSEGILKFLQTEDHKDYVKNSSIVDRALTKLYLLKWSFSGKCETLAFWKSPSLVGKARMETNLNLVEKELWDVWHERFKEVQISTRSYEDVIPTFDTNEAFFYCDPPYTVTEKGGHYELNFTEEDHQKLAEILLNIEGSFLLSYDDVPLIRDLYQDSCYITEIEVPYYVNNTDRKRKTELLIANYSLEPKHIPLTAFLKEEALA